MLKELDVCWFVCFFQILAIETIEVCKRKWDCSEMSVVEIPSGRKLQMASLHVPSACFPSLLKREGRKEKDRKAIT